MESGVDDVLEVQQHDAHTLISNNLGQNRNSSDEVDEPVNIIKERKLHKQIFSKHGHSRGNYMIYESLRTDGNSRGQENGFYRREP